MMKVQRDKARLKRLTAEDDGFVDASPAERLSMVWELTAEVWSLRGQDCAQQRLQRQVARLVGPGPDRGRLDMDGREAGRP
jgi:hypothetical protein